MGLGASSFIDGSRFRNSSSMHDYISAIKESVPPVEAGSVVRYSEREEMGIFVFTGLRKAEGINIEEFRRIFNKDFFDVYDENILKKYKGLLINSGDRLYLSEKGMDISNRIMTEFV